MVYNEGPRSRWRLDRMDSFIHCNNERVRTANIRTDGGRTNSPITKLYPLGIGEDDVCLD